MLVNNFFVCVVCLVSCFSAHVLCFLLVILLFKMAFKHSADVLASVAKEKAVMCLRYLHPGLSYSGAGQEFSVSESAIYIK